MQIKLIPATSEPAVLFAVTFPNLDYLPIPPSWAEQLRFLQHDELELPPSMHTLDRAVGLTGLVSEITFDVPALVISCRMTDGVVEEWPLMEKRCLGALERVVRDVRESSAEMDKEMFLEKEKERRRHEFPTSSSGRFPRHKKQRSLLMTLVASIIPSISLGSSRFPSPPPPPPAPTVPNPLTSLSSPSADGDSGHAYRARARATLVDMCRRYVFSELSQRIPPGGYYTWVLSSLLRRTEEEINAVLRRGVTVQSPHHSEEQPHNQRYHYHSHHQRHRRNRVEDSFTDGALPPAPRPSCDYSYDPEESEFFSITAASLPPTPDPSDDEGDIDNTEADTEAGTDSEADAQTETSAETETDGSSLHTPTSSLANFPVMPICVSQSPAPAPAPAPAPVAVSDWASKQSAPDLRTTPTYAPLRKRQPSYVSSGIPTKSKRQLASKSNAKPTMTLTPTDHAHHTSLLNLHDRLQRLQHLEATRLRAVATEERHNLLVLEERGRKRAWLNRALCPRAGGLSLGDVDHVRMEGPGVRSSGANVGVREGIRMAMPFKSSPLVSCESWTAEEWEYVGPNVAFRDGTGVERVVLAGGEEEFECGGGEERVGGEGGVGGSGYDVAGEYGEFDRVDMELHRTGAGGMGMTRGRASMHTSRLFPVSEEDVEELELDEGNADGGEGVHLDYGCHEGEVYRPHNHNSYHHPGGGDDPFGVDFGVDLEGGYGHGGGYSYECRGGDEYGFDYSQQEGESGGGDSTALQISFEEELESPRLRPKPRPRPPPRVRTSSMYMSHPTRPMSVPVEHTVGSASVPAPVCATVPLSGSRQPQQQQYEAQSRKPYQPNQEQTLPQNHLTPSSLLCQPLPAPKPNHIKPSSVGTNIIISGEYPPSRPPLPVPSYPHPAPPCLLSSPVIPSSTPALVPHSSMYAELDVSILPAGHALKCEGVGIGDGVGGEFTLAMDLDTEVMFSTRVKRAYGHFR